MPTEEEQPGISDAPQQDQLAAPTSSSESSDTKPAIETIAENEQKSDTSKSEKQSEEDGKPAQTKTEPLSTTTEKSSAKEEIKTEDVVSADSSSSTSEYAKTDPLLQARKTDSSPQHQQLLATDPSTDTAVEKAPTPETGHDSQALSEDEEDGDYIPDEEVKKTIMVGSDFQAVIPEGLCRYDDALPYENEDKLLWNPTILNEQEIEEYLVKITGPAGGLGSGGATGGSGGQQKGATGST
uniref:ELM2 domain-containing protein n=1 Tax=Anopheles maculatus TaxID=74869 RepID=A0A182T9C0_9DIPT